MKETFKGKSGQARCQSECEALPQTVPYMLGTLCQQQGKGGCHLTVFPKTSSEKGV